MVCAKTLYNYIDQQLLKVRNIDLLLKVKHKQTVRHSRQNKRLFGTSIEERPEAVNDREKIRPPGDRYGRREARISRSTEGVAQGIQQLRAIYGDRFNEVLRSITSDNGSEFATLPQLLPDTDIYYAHPYSAYERGLNEKQNSLVRRFFPKGCALDSIFPDAVQRVEDWINRFPRKAFGFASAEEIFQSVLFDIAN